MSERAGANFIHKKDSSLQLSKEVEHTQGQRKRRGLETSQKPAIRLSNWFEVLERTHLARGASKERQAKHEQVLERIKTSYHNLFVVKPEEIPESVFGLEVRLARERGEGNTPPYEEFKQAKSREIITAQESSLDKWVDYLTSEDADSAGYPMWARYWAFMAVIKMGLMEKHVKEDGAVEIKFGKRDEHTVAQFAELNPKALAQTIQAMQHQLEQEGLPKAERSIDNTSKVLSDQKFAQMLSEGSFAKIYGQFLAENPSITTERLKETRGEWVRYEHGSDATELYDSLQGHTLEWCTAGDVSIAQSQLNGGDFYVYYSLDASGQPTIPRIAILKHHNQIAEIRGIEHDQHLDPYIGEVLQGKLKDEQEFPNAEEYMQGAEDMKLVTAIERKMGARYNDLEAEFLGYDNPHVELSKEELEFIYELDREIVSLGYGQDPRLDQIVQNRDFKSDLELIYGKTEPSEIVQAMLDSGDYWFLAANADFFDDLDHNQIAQAIIEAGEGNAVAQNLYKFQGLDNATAQALIEAGNRWEVAQNPENFSLDHNQIAQALITAGTGAEVAHNLKKFQGLDHNQIAQAIIEAGGGNAVAQNLYKFQGLDNATAQALIKAGEGWGLWHNLKKFQGLDYNTAQYVITAGEGNEVVQNLENFQGLDHIQIAQALIEAGEGSSVVQNLENFQGLDHIQIAQALIEAGEGSSVAENLEKFQDLDHNQIVQALIARGHGRVVAENLSKYQNQKEILQLLVDADIVRMRGGQSLLGRRVRNWKIK
jgi:uncharacterized protein (DUF433 family)